MQLTARHVDLVAIDRRQDARDVRRIGDDDQTLLRQQLARQNTGRGSGIHHDAVAVFNQAGDMAGDPAFAFRVFTQAAFKWRFP